MATYIITVLNKTIIGLATYYYILIFNKDLNIHIGVPIFLYSIIFGILTLLGINVYKYKVQNKVYS